MLTKKHGKNFADEKTAIATADAGKSTHYGYVRKADGEDVKTFPFKNTKQGFNLFLKNILAFKEQHGLEKLVFGFESTGPYAEPLSHFMKEKGAIVVQVNPMHTKRIKNIVGNSPEKSDKKDPLIIADLIQMGRFLNVIIPEGANADLRRLTQAREALMQQRTKHINRLQSRLALFFPELPQILDCKTKSAQWVLKNCPLKEDIIALGLDKLKEILRKVSCCSLRTEKIELLYEAAEDSIGIKHGKNGFKLEIRLIVGQIEQTEEHIKCVESEIENALEKVPQANLLLSIKGIGRIIAAAIIGEIGDVNSYRSIKDITKLAGLNLYAVSSGKFEGKHRITKQGRHLLRKSLYFAALSMIKKGGIFNDRYRKLRSAGKPHKSAMTILSCKLLRMIVAILRDETPYSHERATA